MIPKDKSKKEKTKKTKKTSIVVKMLLNAFFFTIIPLIITGTLIIYTYQDLVNSIFLENSLELHKDVSVNLSQALQNAKIQSLLTVFIVIILTLFSNILISRNLTRPLRKLLEGTIEVAKGNLDYKIEVVSNDELGELSRYFNTMTQKLKEMNVALEGAKETLEKRVKARTRELEKMTEALEEAKTTLEIRVKARTRELEELTHNLEEQVRQRTKELEEKVKELEKFQKFAVGRELRMRELKEEIKRLKEEKGLE